VQLHDAVAWSSIQRRKPMAYKLLLLLLIHQVLQLL
jgi:hypothetical protein